jgi:hypothetical protein
MVEAADRLHEAVDRAKTITIREIVTHARFLARKEVRQRWKEQGRKQWDYSQKELMEKADELIRAKPELVGLARIALEGLGANIRTDAQKPKPSNQNGISVQKLWSKWWRLLG